jgi:hypothetical protein
MTLVVDLVAEADQAEATLLHRLRAHPALSEVGSWSNDRLLAMLLQRRFISMLFTPVYDLGIDALTDAGARALAREIVREEYPADRPSHREDLVEDLVVLGADRSQILGVRPTQATSEVLVATLDLMSHAVADASDVRVLTMLRLWGEVVVAVEYGELWDRRIESHFQSAGRPSRFYREHYSHDGCEPLATASVETHSGRLGTCLRTMVGDRAALTAFLSVEARVIETRLRFYDQFTV